MANYARHFHCLTSIFQRVCGVKTKGTEGRSTELDEVSEERVARDGKWSQFCWSSASKLLTTTRNLSLRQKFCELSRTTISVKPRSNKRRHACTGAGFCDILLSTDSKHVSSNEPRPPVRSFLPQIHLVQEALTNTRHLLLIHMNLRHQQISSINVLSGNSVTPG